jgi:hypothetical protein
VWTLAKRVGLGIVGLGGLLGLACFLYALAHVRGFEWPTLNALLGVRGYLFILFMAAGLVIATVMLLHRAFVARPVARFSSLTVKVFLIAWGVAILWLAEWVFMEEPLTVQLRNRMVSADAQATAVSTALQRFTADGSIAALTRQAPNADREKLATMLARVAINRPSVFARYPIGVTIARYAERYGVDPILLLHWTYIDSFYGEAPSGPMPFFAEVNGELFRDLVQAHLPPWFVESRLRRALIEGTVFDRLAGEAYGDKLRYAVQKATYDIAISPFMNSVYSDLFLVLHEYPGEFPELFGPAAATDPLARSFLAVKDIAVLPPYHDPYGHPPYGDAFYDQHRDELMDFGRAAVYRLISDYDFATRVQALVAKYYDGQYAARLGPERWAAVPEREKTALLAMLRDVYVPNIGKLSYNVYTDAELNLAPINYLAGEAASHFDAVVSTEKTWMPADTTRLWGATGLMLRVLAETWGVMTGDGLPKVHSADTIPDARVVIARNQSALRVAQ